MANSVTSAAIRLYCDNSSHVRPEQMPDLLAVEQAICRDDAKRALEEVRELVAFCIGEIHECYAKRAGSEQAAIDALRAKRPDIESGFLGFVYRYSSWCVAKGT